MLFRNTEIEMSNNPPALTDAHVFLNSLNMLSGMLCAFLLKTF